MVLLIDRNKFTLFSITLLSLNPPMAMTLFIDDPLYKKAQVHYGPAEISGKIKEYL